VTSSTPRLARRAALLFLIVVAVSACSGAAGVSPPSTSPDPVDPDRPLFTVTYEGGLMPPGARLRQLPQIVVYADGRVITQGPQVDLYPGPLMPNLQERTLSADALARLVKLARDRGLLQNVRYDFPGIADAPDTVLTIALDGQTYRVAAYALNEAGPDARPGIPVDQATLDGRATLREFIDALIGAADGDFIDQPHPYVPTALLVHAGNVALFPLPDVPVDQPLIGWPLGDLGTTGVAVAGQPGMRCQVVQGDSLDKVLPLLLNANELSSFGSGETAYRLVVRPLLPGETGC